MSQLGEKFPFVGRTEFSQNARFWIQKYLNTRKNNVPTKNDITVPVATGSPGIGKTRATAEFFRIISEELKNTKSELEPVLIYTTFNHRSPFLQNELPYPNLSLILRMYHQFFSISETYTNFWSNIFQNLGSAANLPFDLSTVLRDFQSQARFPKAFFFLVIDEFQASIGPERPISRNRSPSFFFFFLFSRYLEVETSTNKQTNKQTTGSVEMIP